MATQDIEKIAKDFNEAYKNIKKRIVICGGTGCIAGGSLDVYKAFQTEMEKRGIACSVEVTKGCRENYLSPA